MNNFDFSLFLSKVLRQTRYLILLSLLVRQGWAATIYVKSDAVGANNGTSWTNAFSNLAAALSAAKEGDEVWVAQGTYKPTTDADRGKSFVVKKGVSLYGGFVGTETLVSQRNTISNITRLSGDIGTQGNNADNSYHVVFVENAGANTLIDGFIIENGNANAPGTVKDAFGGGLLHDGSSISSQDNSSKLTIRNCTFLRNSSAKGGGAIYNFAQAGYASPQITDCIFLSNNGGEKGGAIYNISDKANTAHGLAETFLTGCVFQDNSAGNGGAIYNEAGGTANSTASAKVWLINSLLVKNSAGISGGAVFNKRPGLLSTAQVKIYNTTIVSNSVTGGAGGGLYNEGGTGSLEIVNSIIWKNTSNVFGTEEVNNSISSTGTLASSIIKYEEDLPPRLTSQGSVSNSDPKFVNEEDADGADNRFKTNDDGFLLQNSSPAVNAGNNNLVASLNLSKDIAGNKRINATTIEIGAYELGGAIVDPGEGEEEEENPCPEVSRLFVNAAATGENTGVNWQNAYKSLDSALVKACKCAIVKEIWVAKGTYKPSLRVDTDKNSTLDAREESFRLCNNVAVYGGFNGGETNLNERNFRNNKTILSGDIGTADSTDNALHVVFAENVDGARLDGFIVSGGYTKGATNNRGGGLYHLSTGSSGSSSLIVANTVFENNRAVDGAAIANVANQGNLSVLLLSSYLHKNIATGKGGALSNHSILEGTVSSTVVNSVFTANRAAEEGGGIYSTIANNGTITLRTTNVTLYNNIAQKGGAIAGIRSLNSGTLNTLPSNSIIWGNISKDNTLAAALKQVFSATGSIGVLSNSLVEGGLPQNMTDGGNNLFVDPQFVNAQDPDGADNTPMTADDGLLPKNVSPVLNKGLNNAVGLANANGLDLTGNSRTKNATVDMGAYEVEQVETPSKCPNSTRLFVKTDATGLNDGSSWVNAYTKLDSALARATKCTLVTEIWVAKGTYIPSLLVDVNNNKVLEAREASFQIRSGVSMYGGFIGTETLLSQRKPEVNITILSGNIGNADSTDNAYHVVVSSVNQTETFLDGFTITGGNALGVGNGGGIYLDASNKRGTKLSVSNCKFIRNHAVSGGAIFINGEKDGIAEPSILNCTFEKNSATADGGAIFINSSTGLANIKINNNKFFQNKSGTIGGAIYINGISGNSNISVINSVFSKNNSTRGGALFYNSANGTGFSQIVGTVFDQNNASNDGGAVAINGVNGTTSRFFYTNNTFFSNVSKKRGGGVFIGGSSGATANTFTNCIFWKNVASEGNLAQAQIFGISPPVVGTISNSFIEGGVPDGIQSGGNLLTNNPIFVDQSTPIGPDRIFGTQDDGLALAAGSPVIDKGVNTAPGLSGILADLTGKARIINGTIDYGAYEQGTLQSECPLVSRLFVNVANVDEGDGSNWQKALKSLNKALDLACNCETITEIWVAKGTYFPTQRIDLNDDKKLSAREVTFPLCSGVAVYGGFAGTETQLTQRNIPSNPTILSGNIGDGKTEKDNAFHVVYTDDVDNTAIFSGFTIEDGVADSAGIHSRGAGWYNDGAGNRSNPRISETIFRNNFAVLGGALFNNGAGGSGNPSLINTIFIDNKATNGGAIYNDGSSKGTANPAIINSLFYNNQASDHGGAMYNAGFPDGNASPAITNSTLYKNKATRRGGAMYNLTADNQGISSPVIVNSLIWQNEGVEGDANQKQIYGDGLQSKGTISFSNIQGGLPANMSAGDGITNSDPLFVNEADLNGADDKFATSDDGLYLKDTSPLLNIGNNTAPGLTGITRDLGGLNRFFKTTVDIGAYESPVEPKVGPGCGDSTRIYVNNKALGDNDGSSWTDAFDNLNDALDFACACENIKEVWVAKGTYLPTKRIDLNKDGKLSKREATFQLCSGVAVYGGFAGTETSLTQRNSTLNPTILSGDIGSQGLRGDNVFHVVYTSQVDASCILDGMTIRDGQADSTGVDPHRRGGGWYNDGNGGNSNPTIVNCIFTNNFATLGGALYNNGQQGNASPRILSCFFTGNQAGEGGALFNDGFDKGNSSPTVINTVFVDNLAFERGAAIYNNSFPDGNSRPVFINCTIVSNDSEKRAGGVFNTSATGVSRPAFFNSILWGNTAKEGTANQKQLMNDGTAAGGTIANSIIQDGIPQGITDGENNQFIDPQFINLVDPDGLDNIPATADDGLVLSNGSPAINKGDNSVEDLSGITADILGNVRISNEIIDLGAYESNSKPDTTTEKCPTFTRLYVRTGVTGKQDGENWNTAFTNLDSALILACKCPNITEVWVAKGTYFPVLPVDFNNNDTLETREVSFSICPGIKVYGGFAGTEETIDARKIRLNPTILTGEIGTQNTTVDNAYHVVNMDQAGTNTVLDGFVIRAGNANGKKENGEGAGLFIQGLRGKNVSEPLLANLTFANNSAREGGAIYNKGRSGSASPKIQNCYFISNTATQAGGAIYNSGTKGIASPIIVSSVFNGNKSLRHGAAIYSMGDSGVANTVLTNATFFANSADSLGAALYNSGKTGQASANLVNSIVWGNTAGKGNSNTRQVFNNLATGKISFTIIQDSIPLGMSNEGNNTFKDPLFADANDTDGKDNVPATPDDGLALKENSPGIDIGNNEGTGLSDIEVDVAGIPRILNRKVDVGAYEQFDAQDTASCFAGNKIFVNGAAKGENNGTSWEDAFISLDSALNIACNCARVTEIWVAKGTYVPTRRVDFDGDKKLNAKEATFELCSSVAIYGGFVGGESSLEDRDWVRNTTTLSGELGNPFSPRDNIFHVVYTENVDEFTVLDGFTITRGNADSAGVELAIGGGGWFNRATGTNSSSPELRNILFLGNNATQGGAMYSRADSGIAKPLILNTIFKDNSARNGGAFSGFASKRGNSLPIFVNSLFVGNKSSQNGGATYAFAELDAVAEIRVTNATFVNNTASGQGGAMYHAGLQGGKATPNVVNSIFWDNKADTSVASLQHIFSVTTGRVGKIAFSTIQGGLPLSVVDGGNNISLDPFFLDPNDAEGKDSLLATTDDGFSLGIGSSSFNNGDSTAPDLKLVRTDLASNPRISNSMVDRGAYEVIQICSLPDSIVAVIEDTTAQFCTGEIELNRRVSIKDPGKGKFVVWQLVSAPKESKLSPGQEFSNPERVSSGQLYIPHLKVDLENGRRMVLLNSSTPGTYRFVAALVDSLTGCRSKVSDTLTIDHKALPVEIIAQTPDCDEDNGKLTIIIKEAQKPYSIVINQGTPQIISKDTMIVSNLPEGDYVVEVTDATGCSSIKNISLKGTFVPTLCTLTDFMPNSDTTHAFLFNKFSLTGLEKDATQQRFVWTKTGAKFYLLDDSRALILGQLRNTQDSNALFRVFIELLAPATFGNWKGDIELPADSALRQLALQNLPNWQFWKLGPNSRLEGQGLLSGTLFLAQANSPMIPTNDTLAVQLGFGANLKDSDLGLSNYLNYKGQLTVRNTRLNYNESGAFNMDLANCDTTCEGFKLGFEITDFNARLAEQSFIRASWTQLVGGNAGAIVLERSIDGELFEQVYIINGDTLSFLPENINYLDSINKDVYKYFYRLRIINPDGTSTYSQVIEVIVVKGEIPRYQVFPVPAVDVLRILPLIPEDGEHIVDFIDMRGRVHTVTVLSSFRRVLTLDITILPPGTYTLRITRPGGQQAFFRVVIHP